MPAWKKVITSGSDASLNSLSVGNLGVTGSLNIYKSGSTVFEIQGSQGQLFSVADSLSGSLFSVNDISGIPIFEVFSDDTIIAGTFNQNDFVITDSKVGIGTASPSVKLHVAYSDNAYSGGLLVENTNTGSTAYGAITLKTVDNTNGFSLSQANADGNIRLYNGDNTDMVFYTNASERIRIKDIGNVGIGGNPDSSALLQLNSTTQGFLPPRMTTSERESIGSPSIGLMVFDTDEQRVYVYTSAEWQALAYV